MLFARSPTTFQERLAFCCAARAVRAAVRPALSHFGAVKRNVSVSPATIVPAPKLRTIPTWGIVYVLAVPRRTVFVVRPPSRLSEKMGPEPAPMVPPVVTVSVASTSSR